MTLPDRTLSALHALTTPGTLRDRSAAITEALRLACSLTMAEAGSLTLLESKGAVRHMLLDGHTPTTRPVERANEGIVRAVLLEGRVLAFPEGLRDPRFAESDSPPGMHVNNAVAAPVHARLQNMGVLALYNLPPTHVESLRLGHTLALLSTCIGLALENSRLARTLQRVAVTDELTQVYNYRFLRTALRREMKRAQRSRQPFALLMVDVDHLKEYNDRFGHLRGSYLLRDLARVLSRKVRGMDLLAKYGGDEFTVILPETPRAGGLAVGERIRAAVAGHSFARCKPGDMTVSLGLAMFPDDGIQPASLIAAADAALYAAKQRGRNQVAEATGLILPGVQYV